MPCRTPALGTPRDAALGVSRAGPRPSEGDLESSGREPVLGKQLWLTGGTGLCRSWSSRGSVAEQGDEVVTGAVLCPSPHR